jgi:dienelactone hydrolase
MRLDLPTSDAPLDPRKVDERVDGPWTTETWVITGVNGDEVPIAVNRADDVEPRVALLGGHGVSGSKTAAYIKGASRRWTQQGVQAFVPDLPFHGDRAGPDADYALAMSPAGVAQAMGDFSRCVDFIRSRSESAELPIAFLGFSMSTMLGVPFFAMDERVAGACFAVGGSRMGEVMAADPNIPSPLVEQIKSLDPATYAGGTKGRPVLMVNAHQDEHFSRRSAFDLFDAFGSPKELIFFEGSHTDWPRPQPVYDRILDFVLRLAL